MSELAGGAIGRATLYAKGATEDQAMAFLQPIVIDSHAALFYDDRLYHW